MKNEVKNMNKLRLIMALVRYILFDSSKSINIEIVKFPVEVRSGYDHNFVIWPSNLAATISQNKVVFSY